VIVFRSMQGRTWMMRFRVFGRCIYFLFFSFHFFFKGFPVCCSSVLIRSLFRKFMVTNWQWRQIVVLGNGYMSSSINIRRKTCCLVLEKWHICDFLFEWKFSSLCWICPVIFCLQGWCFLHLFIRLLIWKVGYLEFHSSIREKASSPSEHHGAYPSHQLMLTHTAWVDAGKSIPKKKVRS